MFEPNKNGLVVVKLLKSYAANVAGETAGFLPEIAKALVKNGIAHLPGEAPKQSEAPADGAEVTSRKFKAAVAPAGTSALDDLRAEFKGLTGEDANKRWGAARLAAEIEKAKEADEDDAKSEAPADGGA